MKKLITLIMTVVLALSTLVIAPACNPVISGGDPNKTWLYVGNYNGGVGDKWLKEVEKRFEKKYENYELNGKTGVDVILDSNKETTGKTLISSISQSKNEVFFHQQVLYFDYVNQSLIRDLSGLLERQNADDQNQTIKSKMYEKDIENLTVNGKIYALPHYECYNGLTYDAGIFLKNRLYFSTGIAEDGTRKFITNDNSPLSPGPNGISGDYDDGLPSSFEEFYKMIDKMKGKVKSVIWTGEYTHYTNILITALYQSYMGVNGINAHVDFDSNGEEIEIVTDFDLITNAEKPTPMIQKEVITQENGYLVKQSAGLYYALEVAAKIFGSQDYYYKDSTAGNFSQISAMRTFMKSGFKSGEAAAMLIDGNYWYNEADDYGIMEEVKSAYPGIYTTKQPRFMALPQKYSGTVMEGEGNAPTMIDSYNAYCFINAKTAENKVDLAEKFVAFCYTDSELKEFTKNTNGIIKGVKYDYNSIKSSLCDYAKGVVEMRAEAEKAGTYMKAFSNNTIFKANMNAFMVHGTSEFWESKVGGGSKYLYLAVRSDNYSAKDYFNGMKITQSTWENTYNK